MSPEQAAGRTVDFRSDQFSAGLILYELATGKRAFDRSTTAETLTAVIREEPEPLTALAPRLPAPVRWIIERCLSKDPDERYASTRDLARDLKQMQLNADGLFGTESLQRSRPRASRHDGAHAAAGPPQSDPAGQDGPPRAPRGPHPRRDAGRPRDRHGRRGIRVLAPPRGERRSRAELDGLSRHGRIDARPRAARLAGRAPHRVPHGRGRPRAGRRHGPLVGGLDRPHEAARRGGSCIASSGPPDGSRLFFDRVTDVPLGVFSIPALGGDERLVLEGVQGPEPLPDGSLLVVKLDEEHRFVLVRFWPDTGKQKTVGPPVLPDSTDLSRAPSPGRQATSSSGGASPARKTRAEGARTS